MRFSRVCDGGGLRQSEGITWGLVGGDLTDDGYPEIYISNGLGRRPRDDELFEHVGGTNHWLTVELQGGSYNTSQLGAEVTVTTEDTTQTRWVGGWSSFDSQGPLPITFGLGSSGSALLTVKFTDGSERQLGEVEADQFLVVTRSGPADADHDGVQDAWDACSETGSTTRTNAEGCAPHQVAGVGIGAVEPAADAVIAGPPTFRWDGEFDTAVLQVSVDGTFGPSGRFDFGPTAARSLTLTEEETDNLLALSDGTRPLIWRVMASSGSAQGQSGARRVHLSKPGSFITVPRGSNRFAPAHVVVDSGTTVTWWNDSVAAGNLQAEPHDVQLFDPSGRAVSDMVDLDAAGAFVWTLDEPGQWSFVCHRHSGGGGTNTDGIHHGDTHAHGPFRCMAGTVTVE